MSEAFFKTGVSNLVNDKSDVSMLVQVAIFVVLAMVLHRKPDVLISLLPVMKESPKYQGQDKLPLNVWLITQVIETPFYIQMFLRTLTVAFCLLVVNKKLEFCF